jgi:hypothetical protein
MLAGVQQRCCCRREMLGAWDERGSNGWRPTRTEDGAGEVQPKFGQRQCPTIDELRKTHSDSTLILHTRLSKQILQHRSCLAQPLADGRLMDRRRRWRPCRRWWARVPDPRPLCQTSYPVGGLHLSTPLTV